MGGSFLLTQTSTRLASKPEVKSHLGNTPLTLPDLEKFADQVGCAPFKRNLDDSSLTNYVLIPVKLHNFTRNPVGKTRFLLDVGCAYAKILDVQTVFLTPKTKRAVIRHACLSRPGLRPQTP
jgi:hypothetical protein